MKRKELLELENFYLIQLTSRFIRETGKSISEVTVRELIDWINEQKLIDWINEQINDCGYEEVKSNG